MAVKDYMPETNVKAEDIRDTLNAHGGQVTDDLTTFFGVNNGVNFNAKYKPTVYDGDSPDHDKYWKAYDGLCGFNLDDATVDHVSGLPGKINGSTNGWVYERPRGGAYGEPWRLGDFRLYDPNAVPIVAEATAPAKVQKGTDLVIEAVVSQDNERSLTVADLGLQGYYFGAYIVGSGSNCVKTASSALSTLAASVTFDTSNFGTGDHTAYVFLSPGKIASQTTQLVTGTYYTVPFTSAKTINVTDNQITGPMITCSAWVTGPATTNVEYEFTVTNLTQYSTVSGVIVKFRLPGKDYSDALGPYESMVQPSVNVNVGATSTYYYKGTGSITQTMLDGGEMYVYASCLVDGDRIISRAEPIAIWQD